MWNYWNCQDWEQKPETQNLEKQTTEKQNPWHFAHCHLFLSEISKQINKSKSEMFPASQIHCRMANVKSICILPVLDCSETSKEFLSNDCIVLHRICITF